MSPGAIDLLRVMSTPLSYFDNLVTLHDLALILGSSSKQIRYLLYRREKKYRSFNLTKRKGGHRTIKAPSADLKAIQKSLADFLQDRISFRTCVNGFARSRSIVSNAKAHERRRIVFNIDLKDFFPTINFGRVRGLFMSPPLNASPKIATYLAQICCHENSLPQGAPTSPVISNMICLRMDGQLQRLASLHNCVYTRYADDITFSKKRGNMSNKIAVENSYNDFSPSDELRSIIASNGFQIHPDKIHLYRNTDRQTVTGLVVNTRTNVQRSFLRDIRATICDWRKRGLDAAEATHHSKYYRRKNILGDLPPLPLIIEGKLNFLKMIRGEDDSVRRNLQRQFVAVWPEYHSVMMKENSRLNTRDFFVSHASEDKPDFVRPFVQALVREGMTVWYDEYEVKIGDDLVHKINEGLSKSRFGIVVLSPSFFQAEKEWPAREIEILLKGVNHSSRILPLWHKVGKRDVKDYNEKLSEIRSWETSILTLDQLVNNFKDHINMVR